MGDVTPLTVFSVKLGGVGIGSFEKVALATFFDVVADKVHPLFLSKLNWRHFLEKFKNIPIMTKIKNICEILIFGFEMLF